jgi:hypothetical protein
LSHSTLAVEFVKKKGKYVESAGAVEGYNGYEPIDAYWGCPAKKRGARS